MDMIDDGSFEYLHREEHASVVIDRANGRLRVNIFDDGFWKSVPMRWPGNPSRRVEIVRHSLERDLNHLGRNDLLPALDRACGALEKAA